MTTSFTVDLYTVYIFSYKVLEKLFPVLQRLYNHFDIFRFLQVTTVLFPMALSCPN